MTIQSLLQSTTDFINTAWGFFSVVVTIGICCVIYYKLKKNKTIAKINKRLSKINMPFVPAFLIAYCTIISFILWDDVWLSIGVMILTFIFVIILALIFNTQKVH